MTCNGKIYVGQVGVMFEVSTWVQGCPPVDWSAATSTTLIVMLPDKRIKTFNATVSSDNQTLTYITTNASDLPLSGIYKLQAHVMGAGYDAYGETVNFTVYERFA